MPTVTNILKATFFFGDGRYGWQEIYYRIPKLSNGGGNLGPQKISVADMLTDLPNTVALAQARANMLPTVGSTCGNTFGQGNVTVPNLEYIRVSQVGFPRNTVFYDPQSGNVINNLGLPNSITVNPLGSVTDLDSSPADNPYSGIEMECTLANGLTSRRTLSGIPDVTICDQGWSSGPWYRLWKIFAGVLVQGGWGVASNSITANGIVVAGAQKIVSITQNDILGRPTIGVAAPLAFGTTLTGCPDYRVQVMCYRSEPGRFPNLNGVYRVNLPPTPSSTPGLAMQLNRSFKPLSAFDFGFVMPYNGPVFSAFVAATLTRTVNKKRGRPFGLQVGRASVIR